VVCGENVPLQSSENGSVRHLSQKLEGDGSRTGARTPAATSVRSPELRQWERGAPGIKHPEKKRSPAKHLRGAVGQLEEGLVSLSRSARLLSTQRKASVTPKLQTSKLHRHQIYKSRGICWISG